MKNPFNTVLLLILILFVQTVGVQAQSVIAVVGKAKVEASPDEVRLNLSLSERASEYETAVDGLNQRTQRLVQVLLQHGFKEEEVKTTGFNAQPYYEYQNGKRQQRGFSASQNLEVIFAYDQERLVAIVKSVSKADVEPNLSLGFQLSDDLTVSLKKELLKKAMADAKSVGSILATTQGMDLDGFQEVRYGAIQNTPPPLYRESAMMMKAEADVSNFGGFEAKTIPLYEEVTVVWKVK